MNRFPIKIQFRRWAHGLAILFLCVGAEAKSPKECTTAQEKVADSGTPAGEKKERGFYFGSPQVQKRAQDPVAFLDGGDLIGSQGYLLERWDPNLRTMLYHTASTPSAEGSMALVDPNAKAVAIFFHGSGTAKASGRNFVSNMNYLASRGVACLSMDLPFHGRSSPTQYQEDAGRFINQLHRLIGPIKKSGKKVVLFGHSFGPDMAAEYARRYPGDVDTIILASPSPSGSPGHVWMYENVTEPMMDHIGGGTNDVAENEPGGYWAGRFSSQNTWHLKGGISPKVNVKVLVGEYDQWWPPMANDESLKDISDIAIHTPDKPSTAAGNQELTRKSGMDPAPHTFKEAVDWYRAAIPHVDINVVRDYGHYIFEAKNAKGVTYLNQMILDSAGVEGVAPEIEKTARLRVALLAAHHPVFKDWISERKLPEFLKSEEKSVQLLNQWRTLQYHVWRQTLETLETTHPDYFKNRRYTIAKELKNMPLNPRALQKSEWNPDAFQMDFRRYMEAKKKDSNYVPGPDPLQPTLAPLDPNLKGRKDVLFSEAEIRAEIATDGAVVESIEPNGPNSVVVRTNFNGRIQEFIYLTGADRGAAQQLLQQAYENAWKNNGYQNPGSAWVAEAGGLVFKVSERSDDKTKARFVGSVVIQPTSQVIGVPFDPAPN